MQSNGKAHHLDFDDEEIARLKECFNTLDEDGGGSIGLEEMEQPLIGLGIAKTRDEVKDMLEAVDDSGEGEVEFSEFLQILKGGGESNDIAKFFKDMSRGKIGSKDLSFNIIV